MIVGEVTDRDQEMPLQLDGIASSQRQGAVHGGHEMVIPGIEGT